MSGEERAPAPGDGAPGALADRRAQKRSNRVEVNGWINLDKPVGVTSTQAVGRLKFLFNAKKAGHAGTLDPLASGVLPVALGEATKTVPIIQDGAKAYRFRVRWGEETETDDAEGGIRRTARTGVLRRARSKPRCRASSASCSKLRRPIRRSRSKANAPMTSPAEAKRFAIAPRPIRGLSTRPGLRRRDMRRCRGRMRQGRPICAPSRAISVASWAATGMWSELRRTRVGPFLADSAVPLDRLPDDAELMACALLPLHAGLAELPVPPSRSQRGGVGCGAGRSCWCAAGARRQGRPGPHVLERGGDRRDRGRLFRLDARVQREGSVALTSRPRTPSRA